MQPVRGDIDRAQITQGRDLTVGTIWKVAQVHELVGRVDRHVVEHRRLMLLVLGIRRRHFGWFIGFGIVLMLVLNVRYLVEGVPASIAFSSASTTC